MMVSAVMLLLVHSAATLALANGISDDLEGFGHDTFVYPDWIEEQRSACSCSSVGSNGTTFKCTETKGAPQDAFLRWCASKEWDMLPNLGMFGHMMFEQQITQ